MKCADEAEEEEKEEEKLRGLDDKPRLEGSVGMVDEREMEMGFGGSEMRNENEKWKWEKSVEEDG